MNGKKILIIGASSGIGQSIAQMAVAQGAEVISASRNKPNISGVTHYHLDINDQEPDLSFIPEVLDGLVYCPGTINLKPFHRLSLSDFQHDLDINVLGAVKAIQKYLPILKNGDKPSIILFSTVAAKLGMPYHASIATAKSGVEGLVKSLGAELAPTIRINAIAPTVTDTELASKLLRNEKMIENITERHPLKKFLNPEEVADMAEFLLSNKSASISGQTFQMDCGIVTFKI